MRVIGIIGALAMASGCGGGNKGGTTTGGGGGNATPCQIDPTLCDSEDSGGPAGPTYIDPVAVGFELDAVLYDDGTLHPVNYGGGNENPPILKLIFADADFFSLGYDQQYGHYCEIGVEFTPTPQDATNPAFDTQTGAPLNWSYDTRLDFNYAWEFLDSQGRSTTCAGLVDPDKWGFYAENLVGPFNQAHVGIGFGPMTDYLWDAWGGRDDPNNADFVNSFFTMYVAINDRDGHWGGCDWTSALLFEVDDTDQPVADANNMLTPLDVSTVGTGPLPKGYLRSFAYWYQDFPLMDFSNLTNDPVPGTTWLCQ